jgi:hypothetical protein
MDWLQIQHGQELTTTLPQDHLRFFSSRMVSASIRASANRDAIIGLKTQPNEESCSRTTRLIPPETLSTVKVKWRRTSMVSAMAGV